ncbi:hypothetical protein Pcinc_035462 [Petrolisthes cinctipes]|uniref:Uncharacterized protein n=1 Tax=Petrolisthes cinctipes TaxID=88211 RepID=A0AAE1BWK5_PETCI|nr:hypothetical protein Pcinc_035462 [Petrolisthes cinctipes]
MESVSVPPCTTTTSGPQHHHSTVTQLDHHLHSTATQLSQSVLPHHHSTVTQLSQSVPHHHRTANQLAQSVPVPQHHRTVTQLSQSVPHHHRTTTQLDHLSDSDDTFFVPRPRRAPRYSRRHQHHSSSGGQQINSAMVLITKSHSWSDEFCDVNLDNVGENSDDDDVSGKCREKKGDARTKSSSSSGKMQRNIRNIANRIKTNPKRVSSWDKDTVELGQDLGTTNHVDLPPFEVCCGGVGGVARDCGNNNSISEYTSSGYVDGKDYSITAFDPGGGGGGVGGGLVSCKTGGVVVAARRVRSPIGGYYETNSNPPKPPPLAPSSPPPNYCAFSSLMCAADDTTYGDSDTTVALSDIERQVFCVNMEVWKEKLGREQ